MKITEDYLKELNKGVMLTGMLSEIHINNLQYYAFVFFDNIKSVEIDYNIDTTGSNQSYVHYYIKTKNARASIGAKAKLRLSAIEQAVEKLLWKNIEVKVYKNNGTKPLTLG